MSSEPSRPGISDARDALLTISHEILRALCKHDAEALASHLAADFVLYSPPARQSRLEFLQVVATSDFEMVEAGFEAIDVELAGEVAIVAGIQRVVVKDGDGGQAVSRAAFTDVFVQETGRWALRFAHSLEIAEPGAQ